MTRFDTCLVDGLFHLSAQPVLNLSAGWSLVDDPSGTGAFLNLQAPEAAPYLEVALGRIVGLQRFTSCHRFSPFWMQPATGRSESEIRPETLWLLADTGDGQYTMLVPLLDGSTRFSLRGSADGLAVVAETGDPSVTSSGGAALFIARGPDPYALCAAGAGAVQQRLGTGRLRRDKALPDFADLFGWCTWDAFYKEVSADKVLQGLAEFERGGVSPRLLVLDDGWQTWQRAATGEDRLTRLAPNDERFGGDLSRRSEAPLQVGSVGDSNSGLHCTASQALRSGLSSLVSQVKQRFGVQRVLVWHALLGYWGGLDEAALPGYGVRTVARSFGPGLLEQEPRWNVTPWGAQIGVPAAERLAAFYDDLHASLARQGVDGVKVDVQGLLEGVSAGQGGRVALARAARSALEASATRHFDGRLINCMSSTSECAYLAHDSTLMRSSDDFFPQRPASHGQHLYVNATVGLWFGEFMHPDWDMFQSRHERGAFHAAARAISGGPVYVSDKPGVHDFELLRKLVLSDGSVLRADGPGRLAPDSLFTDPTTQAALLKIFNRNGDCGVVGLFHAQAPTASAARIDGDVGPGDVPSLAGGEYAAYGHRSARLWRCASGERSAVSLAPGEWELVSMAPIEHGFAALGLADKFNGTGAITKRAWVDGACQLALRDGGHFVAWAEHRPFQLQCNGLTLAFDHDATSGRLDAELPVGSAVELVLRWQQADGPGNP